jgi:threonine/homoserine/homoserine lactone efflux protein
VTEASLLAFVPLAALLTLTPGADTMLVAKNAVGRGPASGAASALGVCTGLFAHAAASVLGLSVILARSAELYHWVKLAGAAYLIYLGAAALWRCRQDLPPENGLRRTALRRAPWRTSYREGLLCNVLNPKAAVFYLSLLPQFIAPGGDVLAWSLVLAGIHAGMAIVWLTAVSLFLDKLGGLVSGDRLRRRMEAASGAVLAALGIGLALEET